MKFLFLLTPFLAVSCATQNIKRTTASDSSACKLFVENFDSLPTSGIINKWDKKRIVRAKPITDFRKKIIKNAHKLGYELVDDVVNADYTLSTYYHPGCKDKYGSCSSSAGFYTENGLRFGGGPLGTTKPVVSYTLRNAGGDEEAFGWESKSKSVAKSLRTLYKDLPLCR